MLSICSFYMVAKIHIFFYFKRKISKKLLTLSIFFTFLYLSDYNLISYKRFLIAFLYKKYVLELFISEGYLVVLVAAVVVLVQDWFLQAVV